MQTIEFQSKLVNEPQSLNIRNGITTFIGGNGSGKSSILEAIFKQYINDDESRVICFSSGQNELYTELFNTHKKTNRRYLRERNEPIQSFYFNSDWIRLLIFWSSVFVDDGLVRKYLLEQEYIELNDLNDDISSHLEFRFRIRKNYVTKIRAEIEREEIGEVAEDEEGYGTVENLLRKTEFHETLERIIDKFEIDFDFQNNENLVKRRLTFDSEKAFEVFTHKNIDKLFSFWALSTNGYLSNSFLNEFRLRFKNGLEFKHLSDGEYQMLSTYAIIDLFDSENTIFLFDEIDSHLYYENLKKMWSELNNCHGTIITTTHISESILQNKIENLKFIERGKIAESLTFNELSKRLSNIVGRKKYKFDILSRVEYPVLIDNINDWLIFKKLAAKKLGNDVYEVLDQFLPIDKSSSFDNPNERFGAGKLNFIEQFRLQTDGKSIMTKNIFLICDKDELPENQIKEDLIVQIHNDFKEVKKFNSNRTLTHLLSWKRREIENYFLSPTLMDKKECEASIRDKYNMPDFTKGQNLDNISDIRNGEYKAILRPLYNEQGFGFKEEMVDDLIEIIPAEEISADIEKMYNYLKGVITNE